MFRQSLLVCVSCLTLDPQPALPPSCFVCVLVERGVQVSRALLALRGFSCCCLWCRLLYIENVYTGSKDISLHMQQETQDTPADTS